MSFHDFLQQALPLLGLAWKPHHRRGLRRRCLRRMDALRIRSWEPYLHKIQSDRTEERVFLELMTVTISRFFRDLPVYRHLEEGVMPRILDGIQAGGTVRAWSAGCANGEEPYSLSMVWAMRFQDRAELVVEAQDRDPDCIRRARQRLYGWSSLREVPPAYLQEFFEERPGGWLLKAEVANRVRFHVGDLESAPSPGPYHLIFCRNTTFTYGGPTTQRRVLGVFHEQLAAGGYLIIGQKEKLPQDGGWETIGSRMPIFRRLDG